MVGKCDKMITLHVAVEQETVWLNRNQMAELFGRDIKTIGKHINNALNEEISGFGEVPRDMITVSTSMV